MRWRPEAWRPANLGDTGPVMFLDCMTSFPLFSCGSGNENPPSVWGQQEQYQQTQWWNKNVSTSKSIHMVIDNGVFGLATCLCSAKHMLHYGNLIQHFSILNKRFLYLNFKQLALPLCKEFNHCISITASQVHSINKLLGSYTQSINNRPIFYFKQNALTTLPQRWKWKSIMFLY